MPDPALFLPPPAAHRREFRVGQADIDELGHANNVVWVRYVNEVAIDHSRTVGLDRAAYQALGVLWVVRRHDIEYLGAAFEGDTLVGTTWVASLRGATSLRRTLFHRGTERAPLVRAETTWALLDAATGRPRRIPSEVLGRYGFGA